MKENENRKKYNFQKLTPVNDGDIGIYSEALDFVFNENDLKNVAVTGPYSAGKSSVLETFKHLNEKKKFIHISLAHFEVVDKKDDHKDYKESILEGKILNQLIHQIDPQNIPQTHFKIKRKPSRAAMLINTGITVLFIVTVLYVIGFEKWSAYVNALEESWLKPFLSFAARDELLSVAGVVGLGILFFWIYSFIKIQKEKNVLRKVSFHGNEIEIFEKNDESYFDKYLNEVLYVFQNAEVDVIVFEDIDRFNSNKIFEKLREINYLLNKKSDKCIRFFYLLRDDIFTTKDRTKFFDFILPIVPVIDASNSYDQFIEHFKQGKIMNKFDESFLQGLSLYIDDMRILKNIYNEFVIYDARIQSTELNENKLLALITLKNMFPRDFSELQLNRGFVYNLFSSKEEFIKSEVEKIDVEIDIITSKISDIENELLEDIDELDAVFLLIGNGTFNVNGKNEKQFSNRAEFVRAMKETPNSVTSFNGRSHVPANINRELELLINKPEYVERKEAIENRAANRTKTFQGKIAELENQKHILKNKKLQEIITRENIKDIFSIVVTDEVGKEHGFVEVKANPYFQLIKYLIRNGHIDETYPDYLTYFYENSLSRIDKIFLRSVSDQVAKEFGYELKDLGLVVSRLRDVDFSCEETLNFDLAEHLLLTDHDYLSVLLKQLKDDKRFDFIWRFIEQSKMISVFVKKLHHQWPMIWSTIEHEEVFNVEQKKQYMIYTIYHTDDEDVLVLNSEGVMTQYLSKCHDFLDISEPDIERIISVLELIDTKFKKISFENSNKSLFQSVYESHLYELNYDMLSLIISEIYNEKSVEVPKHSNFSIINSKPQEPLLSYVSDNMNQYVEVVLENCDGLITDNEDSALKLLNNSEVEADKKSLYINYLDTILANLRDVTEDSLWEELIREGRIEYSADNILEYYFSYSGMFDNTLLDFINGSDKELNFDYEEITETYGETKVEDFIVKAVQQNDLSDLKYKMVLQNCNTQYESFEFSEVQSSKVTYLIDSGIIAMSKDNVLFVREHYSDQAVPFAIRNIKDYVALIDEEIFELDEFIKLLHSALISDASKIELLDKTTSTVSIRDENFSDTVTLHIMQHHFDLDDLSHIVKNYATYSEEIKHCIDALTLENIDVVIDNQVEMVFEHLIKTLSVDSLSKEMKYSLFAIQLPKLSKEKTIKTLNVLEAEDLLSLFAGKRPKFKINSTNEMILEVFEKRHWISQFHVDKNESEYYRAIGRKIQKDDEGLTVELL